MSGSVIVLALFVISMTAPILAPYDPSDIDVKQILMGPTRSHPLGTDQLGRDVLSRMIWGSRISLRVGFVAVGDRNCHRDTIRSCFR